MRKVKGQIYIEESNDRCIYKTFFAELTEIDMFKYGVANHLLKYGDYETLEFKIWPFFDGDKWYLMFNAETDMPYKMLGDK